MTMQARSDAALGPTLRVRVNKATEGTKRAQRISPTLQASDDKMSQNMGADRGRNERGGEKGRVGRVQ